MKEMLSHLGEDGGPDRLNVWDVGCLDQRLKLVGLPNTVSKISYIPTYASSKQEGPQWKICASNRHENACRSRLRQVGTYGDLNAIIGENQRRIGRSEFSGRHFEKRVSMKANGEVVANTNDGCSAINDRSGPQEIFLSQRPKIRWRA